MSQIFFLSLSIGTVIEKVSASQTQAIGILGEIGTLKQGSSRI